MSLRTVIRNWLLKPSKAELANTDGQGKIAAELVWGHVEREWKRNIVSTFGVDATADGVVFSEGLPAGMVAYTQNSSVGVDFGDVQPGELD